MLNEVAILTTLENSSNFLDTQNRLPLQISTQDLIKIVEQASTISEHLNQEFIPREVKKEEKIIESRLERWCEIVAKGDRTKFLKRLNWGGLDANSARAALGDVSLVNPESLPSWTVTLKKAMAIAAAIAENVFKENKYDRYPYLDAENSLPFEEIYLPFVEVAQQKISKKIGSSRLLLTDEAYIQLLSGLVRQLTNLFAKTLDLEFSLVRAYQGSQLFSLICKLQQNPDRQLYKEFVQNLLRDGLLAFFQEYSVLARLASIATDFWVETTAEFLLRLASDWDQLEHNFALNGKLEKVAAIKTGLSDLHNCGHSVIIIKFTSDLKLVYKPKNLSLEQAYFDFLGWINQQNKVLPFKILKIINCSAYGWIEFVESSPCQDLEAVHRYYQRAGMTMCLVYALRGTDCHQENLIACGEQPVLIDLETLLHHRTWAEDENAEAITIAQSKLWDSVVATALLPGAHSIVGPNKDKALDLSGLGNNDEEVTVRSPRWKNINTDIMAIAEEEIEVSPEKNLPFGKDLNTSIGNYVADLITGFEQMYHFLRDRREFLLTSDSPLTAFAHQKVRLVLRNTQLYASILQNSLDPKFLRNGVERSIELDILSRGFLSSKDKPGNWRMLAAEKQALEQLDIPYISAYSDDDAITINSEVTIEQFLDNPSYDDVTSRIEELSNANLAEQISIIQSSLYTYTFEQNQDCSTESNTIILQEQILSRNRENILHQAINIAEELEQKAILGNNNSLAWLGMTNSYSEKKFQLHPLGHSLYDGNCGIALFLAALAKITDNVKYSELALGSLYSLRKLVWEQDSDLQIKLKKNMGIGGAKGLASIVYAFVRIGNFLNEPKLFEEAHQIAAWMQIDPTLVNPKLGIFDGVAGTILSLLSLYKTTNQVETLEQATAWGRYLLNQSINIDTKNKIWLNSAGKPLTGFSDGIAGISYALLSLYAANQEAEFLTAAIEAIALEQNYLSLENCSHETSDFSALTSWGNDLSGIALARLGGLNILDTIKIRQELQVILESIKRSPIAPLDNYSCGNFFQLELLIVAADKLKDLDYLEITEQKILQVLSRCDLSGAFHLLPSMSQAIFVPSFGVGTAGIGYGLLRYLDPATIPSILLWQ